ncbi:peptide MFS transporter [Nonomuraea sp. NPDC046570]|uniref:peptide MFS transporter n=1 Tax=Nonomuraea sp. NPDC046570 TaxID=3155255 RepID=UPI0033DB0889
MSTDEKTFFGHPRGLSTLFGTEMWERFSFYGLRAILVLFLTAPPVRNGLGLDETTAVPIVSLYGGLVYLTSLPGGWIADRLLGARRTVFWGGFIIMLGHISMAIPVESPATIWLGLILIICGTGLLKPNISAMVGYLYREQDDARRDSGFSLFYMGINLGALIGIFVTPWLAGDSRWHLGFGAAAVGMALGLIMYVARKRSLEGAGERVPHPLTPAERAKVTKLVVAAIVIAAALVAIWVASGTFTVGTVPTVVTILSVVVVVLYFLYIMRGAHDITPAERVGMRAYIWLFVAAAIFWMIFQQAAGALTVFAETKTDLTVFGVEIPAGMTQNFNALFVIILAPVFAEIWLKAGNRISSPLKFSFALLMAGLSFVVMWLLNGVAADGTKVALLWLGLVYLMQTIGELCLSPVGLSVTAKLAPASLKGQMMGIWFLAPAVGDPIGGQAYRFLVPAVGEGGFFLTLGLLAVVAAAVLFAFVGKLKRLMGEHDSALP